MKNEMRRNWDTIWKYIFEKINFKLLVYANILLYPFTIIWYLKYKDDKTYKFLEN